MGWLVLDTTDTSTIGNTDSDISFFSPCGSPGVLDDPISLGSFDTVSNSKDGMIERGSTGSSISNNTSGVLMEYWLVSLNSYGNWTDLKCSIEGWCVLGLNL